MPLAQRLAQDVRHVVSRQPQAAATAATGAMDNLVARALNPPSKVVKRATSTSSSSTSSHSCAPNDNSPGCQKPTSSQDLTMPIVLATVIPLTIALVIFFFLHRRHLRRLRDEDANDKHKSLDFGMGNVNSKGKKGRPEKGPQMVSLQETQNEIRRGRGMSLDMSASNPYLLPPGLQASRESIHSLSRTMHGNDDRYRPATIFYPNDGSKTPSLRQRDDSSSFTGSSRRGYPMNESSQNLLRNAQPSPINDPQPPPVPRKSTTNLLHQKERPMAIVSDPPALDFDLEKDMPPLPVEPPAVAEAPVRRKPLSPPVQNETNETVEKRSPRFGVVGLPSNPRPNREIPRASSPTALPTVSPFSSQEDHFAHQDPEPHHAQPLIPQQDADSNIPAPSEPPRHETIHNATTQDYAAHHQAFEPDRRGQDENQEFDAGIKGQAASPDNFEDDHNQWNGAYDADVQHYEQDLGYDPRRLTMGIRPLPPDDPSENPEQRANRIRSFYKEYFEDSGPAPGHVQTLAPIYDEYYEDYSADLAAYDAPIYDPDSGQFITGHTPYAEPITRRAMTPPPQGPPRFRGGIPSYGSDNWNYRGGPRAFSSASGRFPMQPKKKLPPPQPLAVLPTPHMLKDDTIVPIDFAPPRTFGERQRGFRPDSPKGGFRPFSPSLRPHKALMSSFDELAVIPSPHQLRKSGTFTSLDFAPPPRFKNAETASDAGSIRSNRSGMSARNLHAIRAGAFRLSRVPTDQVGTTQEFAQALKPSWDMR